MKSQVDLLFTNGIIITMDSERRILDGGSIAVKNDRILDIGPVEELDNKYDTDQTIDASNMAIMPGLIDTHNHANTSLMAAGFFEDLSPETVKKMFNFNMKSFECHEHAYSTAMASALLNIQTGTTTVANFSHDPEDEAKVICDSGIRGLICNNLLDRNPGFIELAETPKVGDLIDATLKFIDEWDGKADGRIRCGVGAESEFGCSKALLLEIIRIAKNYDLPILTHLSERTSDVDKTLMDHGKRSIEYARDIGLLSPRTIVGHACYLTPREMTILSASGASVCSAPWSELLAYTGAITPIPQLIEAGVNVALGRDAFRDLFQEMKLAALKTREGYPIDPTMISPDQVLEMVTLNPAKAIRMENEIGSLEKGKKADIIVIDLNKAHLTPLLRKPRLNVVNLLVYRAYGNDVDTVVVNGKVLMLHRNVLIVDEEKVRLDLQAAIEDVIDRIDWKKGD